MSTIVKAWGSDDFGSGTGVIGDPTGADAEQGAKIFGAMVDYAIEALVECAEHRPG